MKQSDALAFLPLIKAWGEGKTIQHKSSDSSWRDINKATFFDDLKNYRIKPETIKYRRYLANDVGGPYVGITQGNTWEVERVESWNTFVRWIDTEWQEVEV